MNGEIENHYKIISLTQLLLDGMDKKTLTSSIIDKKVDIALTLKPNWKHGLNKEFIIDEIMRRYSFWILQGVKP
jgi:hypothetical protein